MQLNGQSNGFNIAFNVAFGISFLAASFVLFLVKGAYLPHFFPVENSHLLITLNACFGSMLERDCLSQG